MAPKLAHSPYPPADRITSKRVLKYYEDRTNEGKYDLTPGEMQWRDHATLFEQHGYRLRPRYQPGWKPSWLGTDLHPFSCEDFYTVIETQIIDATRLSDGKRVVLKKVSAGSQEVSLAQWLSDSERLSDKDNHCVPILDYFDDSEESHSGLGFLVMPLLSRFKKPKFAFVNEVVDFVNQTLHGLVYLHRLNVAHRDLADRNIMMDADPIYPESFHPALHHMNPICTGFSRSIYRRDSTGVKYYFIDFGISSKFEEGEPHLVVGGDGIDQDVPERSERHSYDPFPVDIFTLGNVYRKNFLLKYRNLDFLTPLVDAMTSEEPEARPTAEDALRRFENELLPRLSLYQLQRPLHPKERNMVLIALVEMQSLTYLSWSYSKGLVKKCTPKWMSSHPAK